MPDREDLTDEALRDEIELVGDLVVAAAEHEGQMSDDDVDRALGVDPSAPGSGPIATTP